MNFVVQFYAEVGAGSCLRAAEVFTGVPWSEDAASGFAPFAQALYYGGSDFGETLKALAARVLNRK